MSDDNKAVIPMLVAFAVFCEILAVVFTFHPYGSLSAMEGPPGGLLRAAFVFGLAFAATALLRAVLPGPKTPSLFYRPGGATFSRTLYYGFVAAVVLTFYRAALLVALNFTGTEFFTTLPVDFLRAGPTAIFARIVLALAAAYLFYGYVQGLAGGALGRRAGLVVAAALAAATAVWPAVGPAYWVGAHRPWLVFLVWRLPEALALAYVCERARNLLAPFAAVFLIEWFGGVGIGLYAFFGKWPFLFACLVITLAAAEILFAERRRLARAAVGFFSFIFGREAGASLLDAALLAAALAGGYVVVRSLDLIARRSIIAVVVAAALLAAAAALWFVGYYRKRKTAVAALKERGDESAA
jgi:hypothetical protein